MLTGFVTGYMTNDCRVNRISSYQNTGPFIFIYGCFWHGHEGCRYFVVPKTRTEWWLNKITKNIDDDFKAKEALEKLGWKVVYVWECDLKPGVKGESLNLISNKMLERCTLHTSTSC